MRINPPATIAHSPTIEPTERSMPPVTITNVIPIARNAFSATCFDIRMRFAAERKFGAANEKKASTAKSAMNVRSFIRLSAIDPDPTRGCASAWPADGHAQCLHRLGSAVSVPKGGGGDERRLGRLGPVDQRRHASIAHDSNPIAKRHHFVEVRSHENDAEPLRGQLPHRSKTSALAPTSIPRLGSSISSTLGSVMSALPMTTFCWLPPESEATSCAGSATLIVRSRIARSIAARSRAPTM